MGVPWGIERFDGKPDQADLDRYRQLVLRLGGPFAIPGPDALHVFSVQYDFSNPSDPGTPVVQTEPAVELPRPDGGDGTYEQWEELCDGIELFLVDVPSTQVFDEPLLGRYHRVDDLGRLERAATDAFARTGDSFFQDVARVAGFAARHGMIITVSY